jgi:hypothetical protein
MESLFGLPYLKDGNTALRVIVRYQENVRKALSTGQPSAPARLAPSPEWLQGLAETLVGLKFHPLTGLPHTP